MNKRVLSFTLFMTAMFCLTCALGIWQLQRLAWKEQLIIEFERTKLRPPLVINSINDLLSIPEEFHDGAQVEVELRIDSTQEAHAYAIFYPTGNPKQPQPGYWVISPATLADGNRILISRGMIPTPLKDKSHEFAALPTPQKIVGVMRKTEIGNYMTPAPDLKNNIWFARDTSALSKHLKLETAYPFYIQITQSNGQAWPQPQKLHVVMANNHLAYALTWFGLAFVIAIGYGIVVKRKKAN